MTPRVGQIVNFVLSDSTSIRPLIVVRAWGDVEHNMVNGILFLDGPNDSALANTRSEPAIWKTSVYHDELHRANTWHFPEVI